MFQDTKCRAGLVTFLEESPIPSTIRELCYTSDGAMFTSFYLLPTIYAYSGTSTLHDTIITHVVIKY